MLAKISARTWAALAAVALVVVGASVVGIIAVTSRDADGVDQTGYAPLFSLTGVTPGAPVAATEAPVKVPAAAPDARQAVVGYLDAEIAGDYVSSYGQLGAEDRMSVGDPEDWEVGARNRPTVTNYRIIDVVGDTVLVDVDVVAAVSEIYGVSPASATIEFTTEREDGGFRLTLLNSTMTPHFPSENLADPVAIEWVEAARSCDDGARDSLEYDGNLLGTLDLAESLCGVPGAASGVRVGRLDTLADPSTILNAFGEQAGEWSRVVRIDGVAGTPPVHVVVAPLGDRWVVIGALLA